MIAKKVKRPYFVVYKDEIVSLGADAALILAELRYLSRKSKKDLGGFFTADSSFIREQIGMKRDTFLRNRDKLIKLGKIDFIQGSNQNVKSRYKIVL